MTTGGLLAVAAATTSAAPRATAAAARVAGLAMPRVIRKHRGGAGKSAAAPARGAARQTTTIAPHARVAGTMSGLHAHGTVATAMMIAGLDKAAGRAAGSATPRATP